MAQADLLSTPRGTRVVTPHYDPDTFGRLSEEIARFFGTARYLAIQTILVIAWIIFNAVAVGLRFDPYPFILLNLMFSTQAAYAAPLILLAQNRQALRDRAEGERDRQVVARQIADTDFLARELSSIRIALEAKAEREDIGDALAQLTELLTATRDA
jgi:uncharacterized membrane protein